MNIFKWISDELHEHRRYKLELHRCANCDSLNEQLNAERFERSKLISDLVKLHQPVVQEEPEIDITELDPVNQIPTRVKRAQLAHDSFKHVNELKREFAKSNG